MHWGRNNMTWPSFGRRLFQMHILEWKWYYFGITVLDGFFPYLAQMITSMRWCVAYNDLWHWPISSKSFGIGLENRVRSVESTVLDGFSPYLVQMITSMGRCVACDERWLWPISSGSNDLDFENRVRFATFSVLDRLFPYLPQIIATIRGCVSCSVYNKILEFQFFIFFLFYGFAPWKNLKFCLHSFHFWRKSSLASEGVSHAMTFDLDLFFKVIRPWPWKSCPPCSVYSSGWILSIFCTNDH